MNVKVFQIVESGGSFSSRTSNMVTMNSEKAAVRRKPETNNGGCMRANDDNVSAQQSTDESPNNLLYKKVSFCNFRNVLNQMLLNV